MTVRLAPPHLPSHLLEPLVFSPEPHGNCHYLETVCWGGDSTVSKTTGQAWRGTGGASPRWRVCQPLGPEGPRWS